MNILTFDIEEWALAKVGGYGTAAKYAEYDAFLNRILDLLDNRNIKATFFCTGLMAQYFPAVVRSIYDRGHEIGCHSNVHTWMNKMAESEAKEDTHVAVDSLEQCIGGKVMSYRAPAFSIGENNKWMFDILAKEGIVRDASVFPSTRDFGGFSDFGCQIPCVIEFNGLKIKEFPVSMTNIANIKVAFSGGGYFRLYPLCFIKKWMKKGDFNMFYFHIEDILPELESFLSREAYELYFKESGSLKKRSIRYIKSNLGKKGAWKKLIKLIESNQFINLDNSDLLIDWAKAPKWSF